MYATYYYICIHKHISLLYFYVPCMYCIPVTVQISGCDYKILQNYFYVTGIGYFLVFEVLDWMVMSNRSFLGEVTLDLDFLNISFRAL